MQRSAPRLPGGGFLLALTMLLFGTLAPLHAAFKPAYDVEEAATMKLIERGFFDYAQMQIDYLRVEYRRDLVATQILEARLRLAEGRRTDAIKILDAIPKDAPEYAKALSVKSMMATTPEARLAALKDYFATVKEPKGRAERDEYNAMVRRYVNELIAAGKPDEAAKMLETLGAASSEDDEAARYQVELRKARVHLAGAMQATDAKARKELIGQAITILEDLAYLGNLFSALVYPELMNAYILNGEPDRAIEMFNSAYKMLSETEERIRAETGSTAGSPVPDAFFYLGDAYLAKGMKSKKDDPAGKDLFVNAFKCYYKVSSGYPDSPNATKAIQKLEDVRKELKARYDLELKTPGNNAPIKLKAGKEYYAQRNFKDALTAFLEAYKLSPRSQTGREALSLAAECHRQLGQWDQAIELSHTYMEQYPGTREAGDLSYRLGATMYQKAIEVLNIAPQDATAKALRDRATAELRYFVENAPTHPNAAKTAFTLAETQYAAANELRKEGLRLQAQPGADVREANRAIREAKDAFREAIPMYESIVDNHRASDMATLALNKLAWIYQTLEDYEHAALSFAAYGQRVDDPEKKLESTYYAADNYMRAGNADDAIRLFTDILDRTAKGKDLASVKGAADKRLQAQLFLPWAYDAKVEQLRLQLERSRQLLAELEAKAAAPAPEPPKEEEKKEEEKPANGEPGVGEVEPAETGLKVEDIKATIAEIQANIADLREKTSKALQQIYNQAASGELPVKDIPAGMLPTNIAKIGIIFDQMANEAKVAGDMAMFEANKQTSRVWLDRLRQEYPDSEANRQLLFSLFRSQLDAGDRDAAKQMASQLIPQLTNYTVPTLLYLAGSLFRTDGEGETDVLDAALALAANDQLIALANKAKPDDPEYQRLQAAGQRAAFYRARCFYLIRPPQVDKAIAAADAYLEKYADGAFYYDAQIVKAMALEASNKKSDALVVYDKVIAEINKKALPAAHAEATVRSARILNASDQAKDPSAAGFRLRGIVSSAEANAPAEARIWIEAAFYELSRSYALLGHGDLAQETVTQYRTMFPEGRFIGRIENLPAKRF